MFFWLSPFLFLCSEQKTSAEGRVLGTVAWPGCTNFSEGSLEARLSFRVPEICGEKPAKLGASKVLQYLEEQ